MLSLDLQNVDPNSFFNNNNNIAHAQNALTSEARYDRTKAINLARDLLNEVINNSASKKNEIQNCLQQLSSAQTSADPNLEKFWKILAANFRNINDFNANYLTPIMYEMQKFNTNVNGKLEPCDKALFPFKNGGYDLQHINNILSAVFERFNNFQNVNKWNDNFDGHRMFANRDKVPGNYFTTLNANSRRS